jgi:hypothetical protein
MRKILVPIFIILLLNCATRISRFTKRGPNILWTKNFGGVSADIGFSVQQTADKGFILTGLTESFGSGLADIWLLKTDSSGDTLWTKTFGGSNNEWGKAVRQTTDGGYVLVGWTESYGAGDKDAWLIKTNELGDTLWTKTYGGINWDKCFCVQQTSDGGYILTGETESFGAGNMDVWLIKTNELGDT